MQLFPTGGGGVSKAHFLQAMKDLRADLELAAGEIVELQTEDATTETMAVIANASQPNQTWFIMVEVAGFRITGSAAGLPERTAHLLIDMFGSNAAGVASLMGTPLLAVTNLENTAALAVVDVSGTECRLRVTGEAAETYRWKARIQAIRVHSNL